MIDKNTVYRRCIGLLVLKVIVEGKSQRTIQISVLIKTKKRIVSLVFLHGCSNIAVRKRLFLEVSSKKDWNVSELYEKLEIFLVIKIIEIMYIAFSVVGITIERSTQHSNFCWNLSPNTRKTCGFPQWKEMARFVIIRVERLRQFPGNTDSCTPMWGAINTVAICFFLQKFWRQNAFAKLVGICLVGSKVGLRKPGFL